MSSWPILMSCLAKKTTWGLLSTSMTFVYMLGEQQWFCTTTSTLQRQLTQYGCSMQTSDMWTLPQAPCLWVTDICYAVVMSATDEKRKCLKPRRHTAKRLKPHPDVHCPRMPVCSRELEPSFWPWHKSWAWCNDLEGISVSTYDRDNRQFLLLPQ